MQSFSVSLNEINILSDSTREFRFSRTDDSLICFQPGQFYRFNLEDTRGQFERSYSLCNLDCVLNEASELITNELHLVISKVVDGRATKVFFNADVGLTMQVKGPYGRLVLPTKLPKRLFLVATSVGIAPYMSMLSPLAKLLGKSDCELHFIYGTREPAEFVYGYELLAFAKVHTQFYLSTCYSRHLPPISENDDVKGYVQEKILQLNPDPDTDHFLLCGHPGMIDDVFLSLKNKGFASSQVVREKYVFAKDKLNQPKPKLSTEQKKLIQEKMRKFDR